MGVEMWDTRDLTNYIWAEPVMKKLGLEMSMVSMHSEDIHCDTHNL